MPKSKTRSLDFCDSRGDNHAGVWHGDTQYRYDFGKGIVVNGIAESAWVDVIGWTDTGYADGMRPYAVNGFQMFGVHQNADKVVTVHVQAKQHAAADVVNAAPA